MIDFIIQFDCISNFYILSPEFFYCDLTPKNIGDHCKLFPEHSGICSSMYKLIYASFLIDKPSNSLEKAY